LPAARTVNADVKPKRSLMMREISSTTVINVSHTNAEPTTIVQKPKNYVTTKLTNAKKLIVLVMTTVVRKMAIANVRRTSASRLIVSQMHSVVISQCAWVTHVMMLTARPMATVSPETSAKTRHVSR
jgi:hypothetical protein